MSTKKNNVAININHVSKSFRLPHERYSGLKQRALNHKRGKGFETQEVLNDISFDIQKGEFFGIVGRNGSGKSTLLKLMAGIYSPERGGITVNGTLVPFIELGVGFNPELTGRENIYLSGSLLGFSRKDMEAKYDAIVEFAELERFMDQKLKNYSSGMQVRLAFSIAIRAEGDILLLDEVLAVGDSAFQQKCLNYFNQLKREKKTVILVSHGMASVERFCDRALLLEQGKIVKMGSSVEIAELYESLFLDDANKKSSQNTKSSKQNSNAKIALDAYITLDDKKVTAVAANKRFTINLELVSKVNLDSANIGINIRDDLERVVFSTDTRMKVGEIALRNGEKKKIKITIDNYYTNGNYTVDAHVVNEGSTDDKVLIRCKGITEFQVKGIIMHAHSLFHPDYKTEVESL